MAKCFLPVICVFLVMLLLELYFNTSIQVSPSMRGGNPHIVVIKLYNSVARFHHTTKSQISRAQTKSRSRATKSPHTGKQKSQITGNYLKNSSEITLYSSWNPQFASWAFALQTSLCYTLQPTIRNTKHTIHGYLPRKLRLISNTEHTIRCYTLPGGFLHISNKQQPSHHIHPESKSRGSLGKIRTTDKYENYLRQYNLHRNKCIAIIRTAFQDIRDMLHGRERKRNNNITSHNP
jgi:hypothetical protein